MLYKTTDKKARANYEVLRFCDRLSLILCKNEIPTKGRELEINTSINNQKFTIKKENGKISIAPWIFNVDKFDLNIEERILETNEIKSNLAFKKMLDETIPSIKKWTLSKK